MKGTPDLPQCGFSRTSISILGMQGVDPNKFAAYNVLEDNELRQGAYLLSFWTTSQNALFDKKMLSRVEGIFRLADNTSTLREQRICWRL